jgi:hypothetical protein
VTTLRDSRPSGSITIRADRARKEPIHERYSSGELNWDEEIVSPARFLAGEEFCAIDSGRGGDSPEQLAMADRLLGKATSTFTRPQLLLTAGKAEVDLGKRLFRQDVRLFRRRAPHKFR